MLIEQFVLRSEGEWKSMRSGHSLAFQQFEEIISTIKIKILEKTDPQVIDLAKSSGIAREKLVTPFLISWESESNWDSKEDESFSSGICYLIPIPKSRNHGDIIRSLGYTERIYTISKYNFSNDGTFCLNTNYNYTISEERIWFASENVRCRSSITYSSNGKSILQTSFASEVKKIFLKGK